MHAHTHMHTLAQVAMQIQSAFKQMTMAGRSILQQQQQLAHLRPDQSADVLFGSPGKPAAALQQGEQEEQEAAVYATDTNASVAAAAPASSYFMSSKRCGQRRGLGLKQQACTPGIWGSNIRRTPPTRTPA